MLVVIALRLSANGVPLKATLVWFGMMKGEVYMYKCGWMMISRLFKRGGVERKRRRENVYANAFQAKPSMSPSHSLTASTLPSPPQSPKHMLKDPLKTSQ